MGIRTIQVVTRGRGVMRLSWRSAVVSLVIVVVPMTISIYAEASCLQEPRMCCEGKNNTCRREGARITNNDSFTCFCDSVCTQLGDCCIDYKDACQAVDCELDNEWTEWSPCDVSCGTGFRQRWKKVIRQAMNGGRNCDPVVERTPCEGKDCEQQQPPAPQAMEEKSPAEVDSAAIELAKIIPVVHLEQLKFSEANDLNTDRPAMSFDPDRHNSRQNNRAQNNDDDDDDDDDDDNDNHQHHHHHQKTTTQSNGHNEKPYHAVFNLTDVRAACFLSSQWSVEMTKGSSVCIDCRPLAMRRRLAGQCKGHGMVQRETRWVSVTIPGCHGKWILKKQHGDGSCQDEGNRLDFLFA